MCLRYSSSVVAPTARSSPRASIGFSRLAASTAPSAAPAPTIVCSSSMKRITWPCGLGDLLEHGLEPVLELAAVLRAGDQGADVERDHAPVAQRLGHVAGHDPLGEALDDGGLAHAGLADQDGVVLGAPREHLDHAPDLVVAADHRVELALLGGLGEVAAEALERLVALLGVLVGHAVRAAHLLHRLARAGRAWRRRPPGGSPASASSRCSVETYSSPIPRASSSACRSSSIRLAAERGRRGGVAGDGGQRVERLVRRACARAPGPRPRGAGPAPRSRPPARAARPAGGGAPPRGLRRAPASRCAAARASWDLMVKRSACIKPKSVYRRFAVMTRRSRARYARAPWPRSTS